MHYEEEVFESKVNLKTWKKIIKVVFSEKKTAALLIFFAVIMGVLDVSFALFGAYAIDTYFTNGEFETVPIFIILFLTSSILLGVSVWGFLNQASKIEIQTNYILRKEAFNNLQKLPFSYFDKTPQGWIMARMTSDSRRLANIISWGLVDLMWSFVLMMIILVILFIYNVKLALIIFISVPIMGLLAYYFRRKILVHYRESRKVNSFVTQSFNESFLGAKTTKSLAIEKQYQDDFEKLTANLKDKTLKAVIWSSLFTPIIAFVSYLVLSFVMVEGSRIILGLTAGTISVGIFYLFVDYTIRFFDPIMQSSRILAQFQQAQASAERLIALIEEKSVIKDKKEVLEKYGDMLNPKYENWEKINGEITFNNVTFYYNDKEVILDNFNLHIKPGTRVALVGPTGAGKTTIVNLLSRFYEPVKGEILIDGINYQERSIYWLHKKIGYVLQTPHLFTGTIFENIRYGKLDATKEEVIEASKLVGAHDFILKTKDGYDSEVGEGGAKLSIGEKQLISFARAIIGNPEILILDEATSSIDSEKEMFIQKAINQILQNKTSLVVAHRLSTIVESDLIIYIDKGEIVEMGDHNTLIKNRGPYFDLYKNQFIEEKTHEIENLIKY